MKRILLIAALVFTAGFSFAGDDQSQQIRKLLNRKIIFPEKMELKETTTVEIQIEIMSDGCLALTASNGNAEVVNYIAEKIQHVRLAYNPDATNVFVYKFTFEKELSSNQQK